MIKHAFHHVNLKTTRHWYGVVVGTTVNSQSNNIAFISNDRTHPASPFWRSPGFVMIRRKSCIRGIHPTAFEYGSFNDLKLSFARLKDLGIEPEFCLNHGVATSLYYAGPDQNLVELQVDNFTFPVFTGGHGAARPSEFH